MIEDGEDILLVGRKREYFVKAGEGRFSTDQGMIDLGEVAGMRPGDEIRTHLDVPVRRPPAPADRLFCPRETERRPDAPKGYRYRYRLHRYEP